MSLQQLDDLSMSLVRAYQKIGEIAIIVRTDSQTKNMKFVLPRMDAIMVSQLLQSAADAIFDGNVRTLRTAHPGGKPHEPNKETGAE